MNKKATITAVCISETQGMPRPQVVSGFLMSELGFIGNRLSQGGERQVCLFDEETYSQLRDEGAKVSAGTFGENITTLGLNFSELKPGDQIKCGETAVIEITIQRKGCANLSQFDSRLPGLISGRSGWLAKVIRSGDLQVGDSVELLTSN